MTGSDPSLRTAGSRPEQARRRTAGSNPYATHAAPFLDFATRVSRDRRPDAAKIVTQAAAGLDQYEAALTRSGALPATLPPARYALALVLDHKARSNPKLDIRTWSTGAHRTLFDGRDLTVSTLRDLIRKADAAGPEYRDVGEFLDHCLQRIEGDRRHFDRSTGPNWTGIVIVLLSAFVLAVVGWAGYTEWRYHRQLQVSFSAEALGIGLDRSGDIPDLAIRLDRLSAAADRVSAQAEKTPLRLFAGPMGFDAEALARSEYEAAIMRHLPVRIALALDEAIATEGDSIALYDDLRAWTILSGTADWSAEYISGWVADRELAGLRLEGLAPHAGRMSGPGTTLPRPDGELLAQARVFAADATEPQRAFLELRRSSTVAALPGWLADGAVPGISDLFQRRSGIGLKEPISGLFTASGWELARDREAGIAVQTARAVADDLFDTPPARQNDTPDQVMALLQRSTLAAWKEYLGDLRVRPFTDAETSIFVSGRLSQSVSPLQQLLTEVWKQTGGTDRARAHALQLSIATEFGPMIQYVEQGRLSEISNLFATLNVALGAMDRDEETGLQRLMTIQDRAASITALRQAPLVVVQIVEDVLAQTSATHADLMTNPLTRAWQAEVLPLCQQTVDGRYPFAQGNDADLSAVTRLLAPGGAFDRYFRTRAEPYLDMNASPWRWKPEARFAGLEPDSAVFFQQARAISEGLFTPDGTIGANMTLAALAERGKTFISIGGQGGPVEASTDSLRLTWPGAAADSGVEVSFQTPDGSAQLTERGPWGLLRLLDPIRLRERDEGRRFLVDIRSGGARIFLEIGFERPDNFLSRRNLLKGFSCPQVL